jgi:Tol biopolymer transport system component
MAYHHNRGELVFSSNRNSIARLWKVSASGAAPEPIMGIGENASFLSISREGNRLAYTRSTTDTNVWRYPLAGGGGEQPAPYRLISSTRQEQGPQYSPDGRRIVFASNRTGSMEIWVCDSEGLNANPLTAFGGPPTGSPQWSPDGRQIVFDSRPDGNADIYVISSEGGAPTRLTSDPASEIVPSWSRDGRWIYFSSNRSGVYQIWRMPSSGGEAIMVTKGGGFHGRESPDGRYIYYAKALDAPGLWRVPASGGDEKPVLESLRAGYWAYWAVVENGIYFLGREQTAPGAKPRYTLNFVNSDTSQVRVICELEKRPFNSGLALSPDRKFFLYTQVDSSDTDILLVENFR